MQELISRYYSQYCITSINEYSAELLMVSDVGFVQVFVTKIGDNYLVKEVGYYDNKPINEDYAFVTKGLVYRALTREQAILFAVRERLFPNSEVVTIGGNTLYITDADIEIVMGLIIVYNYNTEKNTYFNVADFT